MIEMLFSHHLMLLFNLLILSAFPNDLQLESFIPSKLQCPSLLAICCHCVHICPRPINGFCSLSSVTMIFLLISLYIRLPFNLFFCIQVVLLDQHIQQSINFILPFSVEKKILWKMWMLSMFQNHSLRKLMSLDQNTRFNAHTLLFCVILFSIFMLSFQSQLKDTMIATLSYADPFLSYTSSLMILVQ